MTDMLVVRGSGEVVKVLLDKQDYRRVMDAGPWNVYRSRDTWYCARGRWRNGRSTTEKLHRFLLNAPAGLQVDHINGDGLDNRSLNLRLVTHAEQGQNRKKSKGSLSRYRGVSLDPRSGRWQARVRHKGKDHHFGMFKSEALAAKAAAAGRASLFTHAVESRHPVEEAHVEG